MSFKTTNGILVFVQGDSSEEWYLALPWQAEEFVKVMRFGHMKSMGSGPLPLEITEPFTQNGFKYQFHIHNEWGPCYIKNMTTGKEREIKYLEMMPSKKALPGKQFEEAKPAKVTPM